MKWDAEKVCSEYCPVIFAEKKSSEVIPSSNQSDVVKKILVTKLYMTKPIIDGVEVMNLIPKTKYFITVYNNVSHSLFPLLFFPVETVHYYRAKDTTQRCSIGTLFHEGKERLLLNSNPMFGAYVPGQWSSHSSPALLANHVHTFATPSPATVLTASLQSAAASVLLPSSLVLGRGETSMDSKSANNLSKISIGDLENKNIAARIEDVETAIDKDTFINGEESQDPILSSTSVRLKGSQERERLDRVLKARWVKIFELASGMVAGSGLGQQKSHAVSSKTGHAAKPAEVSVSVDGSQAAGRNFLETHTDGSSNGTVKAKVKKTTHSVSSTSLSSAPTVADAQALLDEACSMQPYVNAPGESFTETIRLVLGELMTVSS